MECPKWTSDGKALYRYTEQAVSLGKEKEEDSTQIHYIINLHTTVREISSQFSVARVDKILKLK